MTAAALLGRIDAGPGASVKDSFADLDLTPYGFRVLFDARWIHRPAGAAPRRTAPAPLTPVSTPAGLVEWAAAHGGGPLFRPALLADPRVRVLARLGATGVTGGAILHRGGPVVGVSNVFARTGAVAEIWAGLPATAPLVGYEAGDDLAVAQRVGFRPGGTLRIWLRD